MVKKKKAKKTKTAKEKIRDDVIAVLTIQLGDELIDKVKTGEYLLVLQQVPLSSRLIPHSACSYPCCKTPNDLDPLPLRVSVEPSTQCTIDRPSGFLPSEDRLVIQQSNLLKDNQREKGLKEEPWYCLDCFESMTKDPNFDTIVHRSLQLASYIIPEVRPSADLPSDINCSYVLPEEYSDVLKVWKAANVPNISQGLTSTASEDLESVGGMSRQSMTGIKLSTVMKKVRQLLDEQASAAKIRETVLQHAQAITAENSQLHELNATRNLQQRQEENLEKEVKEKKRLEEEAEKEAQHLGSGKSEMGEDLRDRIRKWVAEVSDAGSLDPDETKQAPKRINTVESTSKAKAGGSGRKEEETEQTSSKGARPLSFIASVSQSDSLQQLLL